MNEAVGLPDVPFEAFVASRPDEEVWELIEGRFLMQGQPSVEHQLVAGNIEHLLNDALERAGIARFAVQGSTVDLRPAFDAAYVPDVCVLDATDDPRRNTSRTCFLAVEVVSPSDRRVLPGTDETKIAAKMRGYRSLPSCEAILVVALDEQAVTLHLRGADAWQVAELRDPTSTIALPGFGLACSVADCYRRTSVPVRN